MLIDFAPSQFRTPGCRDRRYKPPRNHPHITTFCNLSFTLSLYWQPRCGGLRLHPPLFARSALHESRAVRFVVRMPPPAEKGRKRQKTGASETKRRFPCLSAVQLRIAVERGHPRRNGAGRFPDPARFRRSRDMSRGKYP